MDIIYTLHDYMLHSKNAIYILMGLGLIVYLCWWLFLTGRDDPKRVM